MKICVLGSGSQGNSVFIKTENTTCLVDTGFSFLETHRRLKDIGESAESIEHIFITHEHEDHVRGLGPFSRKSAATFYMSRGTYLSAGSLLKKNSNVHIFEDSFLVGTLAVHPFSISHDAAEPVGFSFECEGKKCCVATDMGYATPLVLERLRGSDAIILESNHDEDLLMHGPYPWVLKQRIASRVGHLSNRQAGELAKSIASEKLKFLFLAHRSEANNSIAHAHEAMEKSLDGTATSIFDTYQEKHSGPVFV